jgi:hypothetical protein
MADEDRITDAEHDAGIVPADKTVGTDINLDSAVNDLAASLKLADATIEKPETTKDVKPKEGQAPAADATAQPAAPQPAAPAADPGDRPPDTWKAEAKAKWAGVDPELKAEIQRREQDIARYVGETSPKVQIADRVTKVVEPFYPVMQQFGIDPLQHIQTLLAAHYNLVFSKPEVKLEMVRNLCRDIGVDPTTVSNPNAAPNEQFAQWRHELMLRDQEITRLKQGVSGLGSQFQEAKAAELSSGIMAFAQDTEAHPFFWDLIDDVKGLITNGQARSLEEAYEIAELRNPGTRAKRLELENSKAQAARDAENATKVASARRATSANVQSRNSGRRPEAEETIHDTLTNKMAEIRSRSH